MKTEGQTPRGAALEQAAEWYWQIRESDVSAETIASWQAWLQASGQNRRAFSSIEQTLQQVDQVEDAPWPTEENLLKDTYDGSIPITEWRAQRQGLDGGGGPDHIKVRPRHLAIAASVLMVIAVGTIAGRLDLWSGISTPPDFAIYETHAAEHRDVNLPDGSTVTLGGKSVISTAYTPTSRLIILSQGAAFFDVEKDTDRPFIVEARGRRIAAVGTAFNVNRQVDRVVVTVTEGTVIVSPKTGENATPVPGNDRKASNVVGLARLEAGHQLAYNESQVMPVTIANPADAIAWREGRLKYRGEFLRYVVDDVNRYTRRPIMLADEAVGQVSFTGTVFEESIDSWLRGLEQVFPVEVEETPEGVVIRHNSNQSP